MSSVTGAVGINTKCDLKSFKLFCFLLCSFLCGGLVFMSYFRPRKRILQRLLMNDTPTYIEVDASSLIQSDCNLKCSFFRKSISDPPNKHQDALQILSESSIGINTVHLHSFLNPLHDSSYGNMSNIIAMAQRIYSLNLYFHLTLHFSDSITPNDEHQIPPESWREFLDDLVSLKQKVHDHTVDVLSKLQYLHIPPHLISIELLDPKHPLLSHCRESEGEKKSEKSQCSMMENYGYVLNGSLSAIQEIFDDEEDIPIMFPLNEFTADQTLSDLETFGVHFDIIAVRMDSCSELEDDNVMTMEMVKDRLSILSAHSVIVSVDTMENGHCFESMRDDVEGQQLEQWIGIEYPLMTLFEESGALRSDIYALTIQRKRQLNWTYVLLTVLFVAAIAYNYCFWNKQKTQQQRQLLGILKSSI